LGGGGGWGDRADSFMSKLFVCYCFGYPIYKKKISYSGSSNSPEENIYSHVVEFSSYWKIYFLQLNNIYSMTLSQRCKENSQFKTPNYHMICKLNLVHCSTSHITPPIGLGVNSFVLDQYNQLYFYNARSPKQQSTCRHIASLGYIILVPSRSYSLLLLAQKQQSTCRHIASLGYTILVPSRPNSLLLLAQRRSSKYKCY
jgi:hypothetical protein